MGKAAHPPDISDTRNHRKSDEWRGAGSLARDCNER
jgi:hypothetical protein